MGDVEACVDFFFYSLCDFTQFTYAFSTPLSVAQVVVVQEVVAVVVVAGVAVVAMEVEVAMEAVSSVKPSEVF